MGKVYCIYCEAENERELPQTSGSPGAGAVVGGATGAWVGSKIGIAGAFGAVSGLWPLMILGALLGAGASSGPRFPWPKCVGCGRDLVGISTKPSLLGKSEQPKKRVRSKK